METSLPPSNLVLSTLSVKEKEANAFHADRKQYRTVYDYISESIRNVRAQQRSQKQQNFSTRIKRPQNNDVFLRRILENKRSKNAGATLPLDENNNNSTATSHISNQMRSPESFVNYINHARFSIGTQPQSPGRTKFADSYQSRNRSFVNNEFNEQPIINNQ